MSVHVLQLTDLHIFAEPDAKLKGIPTRETFDETLSFIRQQRLEFDAVIITGDLTHDEQRETYLAVRERLEPWLSICQIVPGNHDERELIREIFPEIVPQTGPLTFSIQRENWRLIGLDTHSPGEVPGVIDESQIAWLDEELKRSADQMVGVFFHHPPIPVNSPWMDRIALQNPEPLLDVLSAHSHIQFVCTGHVHHESQGEIGTAAFYTTPSTGIQFNPNGDVPTFDAAPPGFRTFQLNQDGYRTEVHRLAEARYVPIEE
ncbi:MAG: 3',5'-cyclic-AMP phosphodiesterase [Planctomycetaceae bacterium]